MKQDRLNRAIIEARQQISWVSYGQRTVEGKKEWHLTGRKAMLEEIHRIRGGRLEPNPCKKIPDRYRLILPAHGPINV